MATILQQQKKLEKLSPKVTIENIFQALKHAEKLVLDINKSQLSDGDNSLGDNVGTYHPDTQAYYDADSINRVTKSSGDPYNFDWSGSFFDGFELSVQGIEATISSTGVGSGGKKKFLTTNNLFGLQEDNLKTIIKEEILPFMHKIARETLGI